MGEEVEMGREGVGFFLCVHAQMLWGDGSMTFEGVPFDYQADQGCITPATRRCGAWGCACNPVGDWRRACAPGSDYRF